MNVFKIIRNVAWVLVALVALAVGALALGLLPGARAPETAGGSVGGPFTLVDQNGNTVTDAAVEGRPYAVFFGFTHCPDVCPTTLYELGGMLEELGPEGKPIAAFFVTVDPERDTPEVLRDYLTAFGPRITGLTGTPEQVAEMVDSYRVYAERVPLDEGGYTMDHSGSVLLFDASGALAGTISHGEPRAAALDKLKRLAASA